DQADIIPKKPVQKRHENFEAFLLNDASHHSKNRADWRKLKIHFLEKRLTANLFSPKPSCIVPRWDYMVRRRIPAGIIDAVQNGTKEMRIFAQHTVETMAASRPQDFAPVMFAYRCKPVGIEDSAFQEVQASKKLDSVQGEKPLRQICKPEIDSPKTALVSHMMDGKYSFEWKPQGMYKYRQQRRGPIVRVQNLQLRRQSSS